MNSEEQIHLAARLYYVDGLGQAEVAKLVRVSQAKVSRLLALAKEKGIVRITVADYEPRNQKLEKELLSRFGLHHAIVIRTVNGLSAEETRHMVAHFAAPLLEKLIPRGCSLAIGGGHSLEELVKALPAVKKDVMVIQAMGGADSHVAPYDAHELSQMVAEKWGGHFFMFNAPALLPDKRTLEAFSQLEQIRIIKAKLRKADVALVGVGTLEKSVFVERNIFGREGFEQFRKSGAVGEICGRYFNNKGKECATTFRDRLIGISLETLRRIPEVIAVAAGEDRAAALAAAIRGKLVKSLVFDEAGARALLGEG